MSGSLKYTFCLHCCVLNLTLFSVSRHYGTILLFVYLLARTWLPGDATYRMWTARFHHLYSQGRQDRDRGVLELPPHRN